MYSSNKNLQIIGSKTLTTILLGTNYTPCFMWLKNHTFNCQEIKLILYISLVGNNIQYTARGGHNATHMDTYNMQLSNIFKD